MIGIEFIKCVVEDCPNEFRKGEGHLVACCCGSRPICNDCYKRLKKEGKLKDRNFKKTEVSKEIKENMR